MKIPALAMLLTLAIASSATGEPGSISVSEDRQVDVKISHKDGTTSEIIQDHDGTAVKDGNGYELYRRGGNDLDAFDRAVLQETRPGDSLQSDVLAKLSAEGKKEYIARHDYYLAMERANDPDRPRGAADK
jgi:hypothetical protein